MRSFGAYKIFALEKIIVEYHSGDINTKDFLSSRIIVSSDNNYNSNFDLIIDFRDANMIVDIETDLEEFNDFLKKNNKILGKRKSAYLTNTPHHLVVTTLFSDAMKNLPVKPSIYSTVEGVIKCIGRNVLDKRKFTNIIEELKAQPNILYKQTPSQ